MGVALASAGLLGAGPRQVFLTSQPARTLRPGDLEAEASHWTSKAGHRPLPLMPPAPALNATQPPSAPLPGTQGLGPSLQIHPAMREGQRPQAWPGPQREGGLAGALVSLWPIRQPEPACSLCPVAVPPWLWVPWGLRKWGQLSLDCVT